MTSEEYDKLSDDDKKLTIAGLCGCELRVHGGTQKMWWRKDRNDPTWKEASALPDYTRDLNACREFEKVLRRGTTDLLMSYHCKLTHLTATDTMRGDVGITFATAAQRCKAFVLTMTGG